MAWPFAKIVLKARVSGVAFALALQCESESLAAWTARGGVGSIVAAEVHGGVLSGACEKLLRTACFARRALYHYEVVQVRPSSTKNKSVPQARRPDT